MPWVVEESVKQTFGGWELLILDSSKGWRMTSRDDRVKVLDVEPR